VFLYVLFIGGLEKGYVFFFINLFVCNIFNCFLCILFFIFERGVKGLLE